MRYDIVPVPKPRMTRADAWKKRKSVLNYWAFKAECELKIRNVQINGKKIIFNIPMPKSWPKYRKAAEEGQPHRQKPDIDNLCKALLDALMDDDSGISDISLSKRWAVEGSIEIEEKVL